MKELSTQQLSQVSGGISAFEQADKLLNGMLSWLTSDANPFNGRVIGQSIGNAIGGFFAHLAKSFADTFRAK
ncbi:MULTISPECIES: bacteriocin [Enterobacteriaceae]|uniref:bacteriocin n=1 Tax=Enterobacteriaceae TaxID=543 RepID=UPI00289ADE41|nr:bacteriocin [Cedecea neteri]